VVFADRVSGHARVVGEGFPAVVGGETVGQAVAGWKGVRDGGDRGRQKEGSCCTKGVVIFIHGNLGLFRSLGGTERVAYTDIYAYDH
jgi:hypothetical protein